MADRPGHRPASGACCACPRAAASRLQHNSFFYMSVGRHEVEYRARYRAQTIFTIAYKYCEPKTEISTGAGADTSAHNSKLIGVWGVGGLAGKSCARQTAAARPFCRGCLRLPHLELTARRLTSWNHDPAAAQERQGDVGPQPQQQADVRPQPQRQAATITGFLSVVQCCLCRLSTSSLSSNTAACRFTVYS